MAINRAPFNALVDDDGSGNVGTVWNKNQIKSVLLDPIDAMFPPTGQPGAWTSNDASGAGLNLGAGLGTWIKVDRLVLIEGIVQYPSTSNALGVAIGGLPFPVSTFAGNHLAVSISYTTKPAPFTLLFAGGTSKLQAFDLNGVQLQNVALSGIIITFSGIYYT
jgi:hypothetical protein